jgi:hypothetical protein
VVNILDGESGALFGDLNLDGQAQNPGDGVGVRVYLTAARDALALLAGGSATPAPAFDQTLALTEAAMSLARQVSAADSAAEAQAAGQQLVAQIEQVIQGEDPTGGAVGVLAAIEAVAALPVVVLEQR